MRVIVNRFAYIEFDTEPTARNVWTINRHTSERSEMVPFLMVFWPLRRCWSEDLSLQIEIVWIFWFRKSCDTWDPMRETYIISIVNEWDRFRSKFSRTSGKLYPTVVYHADLVSLYCSIFLKWIAPWMLYTHAHARCRNLGRGLFERSRWVDTPNQGVISSLTSKVHTFFRWQF